MISASLVTLSVYSQTRRGYRIQPFSTKTGLEGDPFQRTIEVWCIVHAQFVKCMRFNSE